MSAAGDYRKDFGFRAERFIGGSGEGLALRKHHL
jgi:hypothetical protein